MCTASLCKIANGNHNDYTILSFLGSICLSQSAWTSFTAKEFSLVLPMESKVDSSHLKVTALNKPDELHLKIACFSAFIIKRTCPEQSICEGCNSGALKMLSVSGLLL